LKPGTVTEAGQSLRLTLNGRTDPTGDLILEVSRQPFVHVYYPHDRPQKLQVCLLTATNADDGLLEAEAWWKSPIGRTSRTYSFGVQQAVTVTGESLVLVGDDPPMRWVHVVTPVERIARGEDT
jgi:hypothetical protein